MAENLGEKFNYVSDILAIADFVRDTIKRAEFNKVVLPFTLLRRLECVLEPTRDAVLASYKEHASEWGDENDGYCQASGKSFYNVSSFRLNNIGATSTLNSLKSYINAFSENARSVMTAFDIDNTMRKLDEDGLLYEVCRKFSVFDFSPEAVSDREMSDIYEHLIEAYGEEVAENAEDFMTPRDIVRLATSLLFANDEELMNSDTGIIRTLYDPTMGTGGFITDALDQLREWHKDKKMLAPAEIMPYGQECEAETWAMGKANLMIRNSIQQDKIGEMSDLSANIVRGDTLADDKFDGLTFDYVVSNPPFGKKWESSASDVRDEARLGFRGRFGAGLPKISDGSMLFLQHVINKMKPWDGVRAGKAAIILSASPLFTGDAGSEESNIRRWILENDYADCIIKLPTEIFFRTGISTYLWILTNHKEDERKGKIQLIDASAMKTPLRKNRGKKRYEISDEQINWIVTTYIDGHDHGNSVLVPHEEFMYRQITTQRPLRAKIHIPENVKKTLSVPTGKLEKLDYNQFLMFKEQLVNYAGKDFSYTGVGEAFGTVCENMEEDYMANHVPELTKSGKPKKVTFPLKNTDVEKWLRDNYMVKDPNGEIVYDKDGKIVPDPDLKDTEDVPWGMDFDEYMAKEVLPFTPDAWIDKAGIDEKGPLSDHQLGQVGTSISFNRYFYKYEVPRDPDEILKELMDMEKDMESSLKELL